MVRFKFDKRALETVANDALKKRVAELQRLFDPIHQSHAGKPASEVLPALRSACRSAEMTPDKQQLTSWAQAISDGTRIVLDVRRLRL